MIAKKRAPHEPYSRLPHHVQFSPAFRSLSTTARALLLDVIAKESGRNNGDLIITRAIFGPLGWRSESTFRAALDELLKSGLLIRTLEGHQRVAARHALSWLEAAKNGHGERTMKKKADDLHSQNDDLQRSCTPVDRVVSLRLPEQSRSVIRSANGRFAPVDGANHGEKKGVSLRQPERVASCQMGVKKNGVPSGPWTPGNGPPMTVYVSESAGAFSLSVRPAIQQAPTILCTDAIESDAVMAAARRALALATQHNAILRLVGTTEALALFDPILAAAKQQGGQA